jgi:hypothetical protein
MPSNDMPPYMIGIIAASCLAGLSILSLVSYFATKKCIEKKENINTENQESANNIANYELPRFAEREEGRNTGNIQTQI